MSRRCLIPAALALAMSVAACGPGSYEELRGELVGASCAWARRCGYVGAADRGACPVDQVLAIFHDTAAERAAPHAIDVPASIAAGRMRYDSVNAGSCVEAVAGAACDPALAARQIRAACNAVVRAGTETDRSCWTDLECTGGVCARLPGCVGVCVAYAAYGAPCDDVDTSPQATRCDPTVAYCGAEQPGDPLTCRRKKQLDQPCADTRQCLFNYTCRLGACVPPVELDEHTPCGGVEPCRHGMYCDPETLLCTGQRLEGVLCTSRLGCVDGLACIGLIEVPVSGTPTHVAQPGTCRPWLDAGAACVGVGLSGCPTTSQACENGRCVLKEDRAGEGERCTARACAEGLGCDAQKFCDWLLATHGDCSFERATLCEPGTVCGKLADDFVGNEGTCVPPEIPACFLDGA